MLSLEKVGNLGALGSDAVKVIKVLARKNPALTTALLGGVAGAGAAGERRRIRGAAAGAVGGLAGGLMGSGLRRGLGRGGNPNKFITNTLGKDPYINQHILGALGGLAGGTLIQPEPTPVVMHRGLGKAVDGSESVFERAVNKLQENKPDIERV